MGQQKGRHFCGLGETVRSSCPQSHVPQQPLLGPAAAAVLHGGHHFVFFGRFVETLVAVHMSQGESLEKTTHNQRNTLYL